MTSDGEASIREAAPAAFDPGLQLILERTHSVGQIQLGRREEIEIFGHAMAEVEPRKRSAARKEEALLAHKEAIEQALLQRCQSAMRQGARHHATPAGETPRMLAVFRDVAE